MKRKHFSVLFCLLFSSSIYGGILLKTLQEGSTSDTFFATVADEKKNKRSTLQKEFAAQEKESQEFSQEAKTLLAELASEINAVKPKIKQDQRNEEFLNSKLSKLNELYQSVKDRQQGYKQVIDSMQEHIKLLDKYLEDPGFETYLKEFYSGRQSIYSFEELQGLNKLVLGQKNKLEQLEKQERNSSAELESRTASAQAAEKSFKEKQEQLKTFAATPGSQGPEEMFGFDHDQKVDLLKLQERLLYQKSELASLRLVSAKQNLSYTKTKQFIEKQKLKKLEKTVEAVRPFVNVREEDVSTARSELNKTKQKSLAIKGSYRREEEKLARDNQQRMKELEILSKQYNIELGASLDDWSLEPKQTPISYYGQALVGSANSKYLFAERTRELLESQISLEDEKLRYQELLADVKITFYTIKSGEKSTQEWRDQEIKKYSLPEAEISATIARFKERENVVLGMMDSQKAARDNIKSLLENLHKKRAMVFKARSREFNQTVGLLKESLVRIGLQITMMERLSGVYRDIVATAKNSQEQIGFIVGELKAATGILKRSEEAIKLQELKSVMPDVKRFASDFYTYAKRFSIKSFSSKLYYELPRGMNLVWFFLQLLLLLLGLLFFKIYTEKRIIPLLDRTKQYRGMRLFSFLLSVVLRFIVAHFVALSIWIILFVFIRFGLVPDYGLQAMFYLLSIPFFLYLSNRFLYQLVLLNKEQDYFLLTPQFGPRFQFIVSTLLYSTVIIQFFRTAFLLGPYKESGFPIIALALNFIIFQVCLIFLITKEQILSLIPTTTETWKYIYSQVDKFFYLVLACIIAIIVMINPYVGFGRLVLHVLSRLFLTALFFPLFYWAQLIVKKASSKLFFSTRDDVVQERFGSAKSWYGLFVIISFVALLLVGFILGAKIWGWPISYKDVNEWMRTAVFFGEGEKIISPISFFQVLAFTIIGFLIAYAFNKFVLKRIFDLLLVGMGIQQAMMGLARYLIIVALIMIGLEHVGLGGLTKNLWLTILGVGWIVREPLGDLVAYFIILIQRPFKIGDYVKIDDKTSGIVRRITPRSIILRKKNSMSIVVPNAFALTKAVVNWNYVSGFIALDDIKINIHYHEDPEKVLAVLQKAVDAHPKILKSPKPAVRLEDFGEYGFKFLVRGYVSSHLTLDMWQIAADLRVLLVKILREQNIEIAIPIWHTTADEEAKKKSESASKIKPVDRDAGEEAK